jgi:D-alanyl-D-alanine carboxypeptidase
VSKALAGESVSALILNAKNGTIILDSDAQKRRHPASLAKLMTIYVAFEAIQNKQIGFADMVTVSANAARMPRTNISLKAGDKISVYDLIMSMIVHSANDSAVALAEYVGGTQDGFVNMMNLTAKRLEMDSTNFVNASGWHSPNQYTNAKDMAKLGLAIGSDFKPYYELFSKTSFTYKGRTFKNHNAITMTYNGASGLKTGYVAASGFNIISTASKDGQDLLVVVMNAKSRKERDVISANLLDYGFGRMYQNYLHLAGSFDTNQYRL